MRVRLILQHTETGKYYSGAGYNIMYSSDIDDAETFEDIDEIMETIKIDYLNEAFEEHQFKIVQILIGDHYEL